MDGRRDNSVSSRIFGRPALTQNKDVAEYETGKLPDLINAPELKG